MSYLLLLAAIITGGTLITYLYDEDMVWSERLSVGTPTGFAAFGLICFLFASLFGFTNAVIFIAALVAILPVLILRDPRRRLQASIDIKSSVQSVLNGILRPTKRSIGYTVFFGLMGLMLWYVFARAMFTRDGGIYTGVDNNLGDLPLHIGIINGFVYGENFPPEHPEFSGARLTYPFLADFITSVFVKTGLSLESALFIQNIVLAFALLGLLYHWALRLTKDHVAALLTPILIFLSGTLGWVMLFGQPISEKGLIQYLMNLPRYFSMAGEDTYRFGNILITMLVTQRSFPLGLPLFLAVSMLWWKVLSERVNNGEQAVETVLPESGSRKKKKKKDSIIVRPRVVTSAQEIAMRRMVAAGIIAGTVLLAHAHTFAVLMGTAVCLSVIFWRLREWGNFFILALCIAVPQLLWVTSGSAMKSESFIGYNFGWDKGETNFFWFWFINTGIFIPLLIAAMIWKWKERIVPLKLALFILPFMLWFIIPNLMKLAPWVWDNIKVLVYWYIASVPLVAMLLAKLWRSGKLLRALSVVFIISLTLSGSLDIWRVVTKASEQQVYEPGAVKFAEFIKETTPPRALILHKPTYNNVVLLSGRRSLMGYDGHLWSHGLDYGERLRDVEAIYAGAPNADEILKRNKIEYVVVGPFERAMPTFNEAFFDRYSKVGGTSGHSLYKITEPQENGK
jgi:hypothetical protein